MQTTGAGPDANGTNTALTARRQLRYPLYTLEESTLYAQGVGVLCTVIDIAAIPGGGCLFCFKGHRTYVQPRLYTDPSSIFLVLTGKWYFTRGVGRGRVGSYSSYNLYFILKCPWLPLYNKMGMASAWYLNLNGVRNERNVNKLMKEENDTLH